MEQLAVNRRQDDWAIPRVVPPVQVILPYIMLFLGNCFKIAGIYPDLLSIPLKNVVGCCKEGIIGVEGDTLLRLDCSVQIFPIRQSKIWHADVRYGLFALLRIEVVNRVEYYYGSLLYID